MHNTIYEITQNPVNPDDWADESNFYEDSNVDYATLLTGKERTDAIEYLCNSRWFCSLFSRGKEPDTIIYNGNIEAVKDKWYQELQKKLQSLIKKRSCNTYGLREAINQPFAGYDLFCLPDWVGNSSCYPRDLLDLLVNIKPGSVLYINSVFDYHY